MSQELPVMFESRFMCLGLRFKWQSLVCAVMNLRRNFWSFERLILSLRVLLPGLNGDCHLESFWLHNSCREAIKPGVMCGWHQTIIRHVIRLTRQVAPLCNIIQDLPKGTDIIQSNHNNLCIEANRLSAG